MPLHPSSNASTPTSGSEEATSPRGSLFAFFALSPSARLVKQCANHLHLLDRIDSQLVFYTVGGDEQMLSLLARIIPHATPQDIATLSIMLLLIEANLAALHVAGAEMRGDLQPSTTAPQGTTDITETTGVMTETTETIASSGDAEATTTTNHHVHEDEVLAAEEEEEEKQHTNDSGRCRLM